MEKDIIKSYIKYYCKNCGNRYTDCCHIVIVIEADGIKRAKCVWYKDENKVKRRKTKFASFLSELVIMNGKRKKNKC